MIYLAFIGLVAIGSLLTIVALLSLAWSRVSGFRVSIGGVRFEDRQEGVKAELAALRMEYVDVVTERDAARQGMDQLRDALEKRT